VGESQAKAARYSLLAATLAFFTGLVRVLPAGALFICASESAAAPSRRAPESAA